VVNLCFEVEKKMSSDLKEKGLSRYFFILDFE